MQGSQGNWGWRNLSSKIELTVRLERLGIPLFCLLQLSRLQLLLLPLILNHMMMLTLSLPRATGNTVECTELLCEGRHPAQCCGCMLGVYILQGRFGVCTRVHIPHLFADICVACNSTHSCLICNSVWERHTSGGHSSFKFSGVQWPVHDVGVLKMQAAVFEPECSPDKVMGGVLQM